MADWHTPATAADEWANAVVIADDAIFTELLEVARDQVMAYAPKSQRAAYAAATEEAPYDVPLNLRRAQLRHAENMWNAASVDSAGDLGEGTFRSSPHPLDWHIKQLIRPRQAVPRVG